MFGCRREEAPDQPTKKMDITEKIQSIKIERTGKKFSLSFYLPEFGWLTNAGRSEESNGGERVFYYETELPSQMDYTEIPDEVDAFTEGWARGKGYAGAVCETEF